ncbi:MAG: hypothetical protein ABIG87_02680 [Patescibacteria group bacterium]
MEPEKREDNKYENGTIQANTKNKFRETEKSLFLALSTNHKIKRIKTVRDNIIFLLNKKETVVEGMKNIGNNKVRPTTTKKDNLFNKDPFERFV